MHLTFVARPHFLPPSIENTTTHLRKKIPGYTHYIMMRRSRGRRHRRDEHEIDLLTTAFNLPTRRTIEQAEAQRGAQHATLFYGTDEDDDSTDDSSSSSEAYTSLDDDNDDDEEEEEEEEEEDDEDEEEEEPEEQRQPPPASTRRRLHTLLPRRSRLTSKPKEQDCIKLSPKPSPSVRQQPAPRRQRRLQRRRDDGVERKTPSRGPSRTPSKATTPDALPAQTTPPSMPLPMSGTRLPAPGSLGQMATAQFPVSHMTSAAAPQFYHQPQFAFAQQGTTASLMQSPHFPVPLGAQPQAPPVYAVPPHGGYPPQQFPGPVAAVNTTTCGRSKATTTAHELQRIQQDLDQKTAVLQDRPNDKASGAEVEALRERLNSTLNGLMGRNPMSENPPDTAAPQISAEAPGKDPLSDTASTPRAKQESSPKPIEKTEEQARRPRLGNTHHTCFSCGILRSRAYHEKHPLAPGKPVVPSLCEGCREKVHKKQVMEHHALHVCFGCGIYRSKSFHKRHPARLGDALLPNYCPRCLIERRAAEESASSSVINSVSLTLGRRVFAHC